MRKILDQHLFPNLNQDTRLGRSAVSIYEELRRAPIGTVAEHTRRSAAGRHTVYRAVKRLVHAEWAFIVSEKTTGRQLVVPFMPPDVEQTVVHELLQVRAEVGTVGEWLMKCILDLVVADTNYRNNPRPEWLALGDGSGRLEIDRWYRRAKVGVEFHGRQHYQLTELTDEAGFRRQIVRDTVKAGLFARQHFHYVEIPYSELGFDFVIASVSGLLPLRPIPTDRPLYRTLANICQSYVNAVNKR